MVRYFKVSTVLSICTLSSRFSFCFTVSSNSFFSSRTSQLSLGTSSLYLQSSICGALGSTLIQFFRSLHQSLVLVFKSAHSSLTEVELLLFRIIFNGKDAGIRWNMSPSCYFTAQIKETVEALRFCFYPFQIYSSPQNLMSIFKKYLTF